MCGLLKGKHVPFMASISGRGPYSGALKIINGPWLRPAHARKTDFDFLKF